MAFSFRPRLCALIFLCVASLFYTCFSIAHATEGYKSDDDKDQTSIIADREHGKKNPKNLFPADLAKYESLSVILSRPEDRNITASVLSNEALEGVIEFGTESGVYQFKSEKKSFVPGQPEIFVLDSLIPGKRYFYRFSYLKNGREPIIRTEERSFHTQRQGGSSFTFTIQSDSHLGTLKHCDPELYIQTLKNAAADNPDFLIDLGDTFRATKLKETDYESVEMLYRNQRPFFGLVAGSAFLFLAPGNHEAACGWLNDSSPENVAVWAVKARKKFFPNPFPDRFYSGNTVKDRFCGDLENYYAWEWGDALFVVLDPWWYSKDAKPVRSENQKGPKDLWNFTLGDGQYKWLKNTLEKSGKKFKFVFSHHVIGTCRGGSEWAGYYEWGGMSRNGENEFGSRRPSWELPIHQLMKKNDVSIFFQGHDHLFAKQEIDGIIYQTCPMPADPTFSAYNSESFTTGDKLPNSGHIRVSVTPDAAKVDYIRAFLKNDEGTNMAAAYSYTVKPKK